MGRSSRGRGLRLEHFREASKVAGCHSPCFLIFCHRGRPVGEGRGLSIICLCWGSGHLAVSPTRAHAALSSPSTKQVLARVCRVTDEAGQGVLRRPARPCTKATNVTRGSPGPGRPDPPSGAGTKVPCWNLHLRPKPGLPVASAAGGPCAWPGPETGTRRRQAQDGATARGELKGRGGGYDKGPRQEADPRGLPGEGGGQAELRCPHTPGQGSEASAGLKRRREREARAFLLG